MRSGAVRTNAVRSEKLSRPVNRLTLWPVSVLPDFDRIRLFGSKPKMMTILLPYDNGCSILYIFFSIRILCIYIFFFFGFKNLENKKYRFKVLKNNRNIAVINMNPLIFYICSKYVKIWMNKTFLFDWPTQTKIKIMLIVWLQCKDSICVIYYLIDWFFYLKITF